MNNINKVKMFFIPAFTGISHSGPMVKAARLFASNPDVQVTIITTIHTAEIHQPAIDTDRETGHGIGFHIVKLPASEVGLTDDHVDRMLRSKTTVPDFGDLTKLLRSVNMLSGPILDLVRAQHADCLIADLLNPWAANVASQANIPLIMFNASGLFPISLDDSLRRLKPYENVGSDSGPFLVPGLPDKVELTRSRIPDEFKGEELGKDFRASFKNAVDMSYCMMFNSFNDLESKYVEYYNKVMGRKCCLVGPLHLGIKSNDKGREDNEYIVEWLDEKVANSVVYISFGSYIPLAKEQFHEIAFGLEASGHSFIWAARANPNLNPNPSMSGDGQDEEGWFPEGFEERIRESNQGLIIKGLAPQERVLGHPGVGTFVTHCGWNSCLETLSNGVPVITWPLGMEQFYNEIFMVDVLKVGIRVGNEEWTSAHEIGKVTVSRDKVEVAVRRMMGDGEDEVAATKKRAKEYVEICKNAIEKGGSLGRNVDGLVQELESRQR